METEGKHGDGGQTWRRRANMETEGKHGDGGQTWRRRTNTDGFEGMASRVEQGVLGMIPVSMFYRLLQC
jgi:hypothetical protein